MVKFSATRYEIEVIRKIADRAVKMYPELSKIDTLMDLEAAHSSNPLQLSDLLSADDGNFGHDVLGIRQNLNRATGKLENCFVPRYSL